MLADGFACEGKYAFRGGSTKTWVAKFQADGVNLPVKVGTCDPSTVFKHDLLSAIAEPSDMFTRDGVGVSSVLGPRGAERHEYVQLVVRQTRCREARLPRTVHAVADVFNVQKGGGRQREVWNGSGTYEECVRPPVPTHLANPSCFVDLMFRACDDAHMSKSDAHTCFDVLRAPLALQQWLGRPRVTLKELR